MAIDVQYYNEVCASTINTKVQTLNCCRTTWTTAGTNCGTSVATSDACTLAKSTATSVAAPAGTAAGQAAVNGWNTTCNTPSQQNDCYSARYTCYLNTTPWCCCYWASIPSLSSVTDSVFVYDTSGYVQGKCCAWTVPSGATYARFQLWGAGAASSPAICCGGSIWGGSGAYASVILPVTPGDIYTVCAGCAYNCYKDSSSSKTAGSGCASFVIGNGLCNFCADGGESDPWKWLCKAQGCYGACGICVMQNNINSMTRNAKGTYYGWCLCGNGGFCWSGTCGGNDSMPFIASDKTYYGCVTNANKICHIVVGAPGMFNAIQQPGSDGYQYESCKYSYHPPLVNQSSCCCTAVISACTNAEGSTYDAVNGYFQCPGRGGHPAYAAGGSWYCGGRGTAGAVCIQYM